MKSIEELFTNSTDLLKDHGVDITAFQRPHYPSSVFYYGSRSKLHHKELIIDLSKGWGEGNVKNVKFFAINNTSEHTYEDVIEGKVINETDLPIIFTELMGENSYYVDPSTVSTYFIFDTAEVESADEFEDWYKEYDCFRGIFGGHLPQKSMLIIILDESLKNIEKAKEFKQRLLKLYKSDECGKPGCHIYDSVFVLSTKCNKKGYESFDPRSQKYSNNNLLSDLILLSNSRGDELSLRLNALYGNSVPAKTAAHGYIEKPNREIIYVALSVIFKTIIEMLKDEKNTIVSKEELMQALGIVENKSKIVDNILGEVSRDLPSNDFVMHLPNYNGSNSAYATLDQVSMGCLTGFLKFNHYETLAKHMDTAHTSYVEAYKNLIKETLIARKISNDTSLDCEDVFDTVIRGYRIAEDNDVNEVIRSKIRVRIFEQLQPYIEEALKISSDDAKKTIKAFNELYSSFTNFIASGVDEDQKKSIEEYYNSIISVYYNDNSKREHLLRAIMKIGNNTDDMLNILYEELKAIFASNKIFKLAYYDELVARVTSRGQKAQELIIKELVNNLDDRILFNSQAAFNMQMEAYFVNKDHDSNSSLINEISQLPNSGEGVSRTIYNTSDDAYAESIWFYDCTETNFEM